MTKMVVVEGEPSHRYIISRVADRKVGVWFCDWSIGNMSTLPLQNSASFVLRHKLFHVNWMCEICLA